jgi:hypothetical protein
VEDYVVLGICIEIVIAHRDPHIVNRALLHDCVSFEQSHSGASTNFFQGSSDCMSRTKRILASLECPPPLASAVTG